ncbi:MAG TPA: protein kinase [Gemmataceae bacterium]|nr:protein kinase [Gemmataceae bacterium]
MFKIEQSLHSQIENPPSLFRTGSFVPRQDDVKSTDLSGAEQANLNAAQSTIQGYEIKGELGRGGMGIVYKAWDQRLKRMVALKIIISGALAGENEMARFRKEAQAVAQLKHPNIVQVFGLGEHDNRPYYVLEYIRGGSLSRYLRGTSQPPKLAAEFVATLSRAMAVAHQAGIVHRDLKPANILLDIDQSDELRPDKPTGAQLARLRPKIADFGLAKQIGDDGGQTQSGAVVGTPNYMAPEQAEGRTKDVGPASDIYALGAILYEMLVGRPPFQGATVVETLDLVREQEPVSPRLLQPGVPRDLETICLKCLSKEPEQRYRTAIELGEDLQRFVDGKPILARPVGSFEQAWKFYRRNPRVVYTGAGIVVLLLLLVAASGVLAVLSARKTKAEGDKNAAELAKVKAEGETVKAQSDKQAADLAKLKAEGEKNEAELKAAKEIEVRQRDLLIGVAERELSSNGDVALAEKRLDEYNKEYRAWEWDYLNRLCDGAREPLKGHEAGLWSVAFNPNNEEIATASIDGYVGLWNVSSGEFTKRDGHRSDLGPAVTAARAINDANTNVNLAQLRNTILGGLNSVAGGNGDIEKLLPFPAVPLSATTQGIPKHISPVLRVAYSQDGQYLASGGLDPNVISPDRLSKPNAKWDPKGRVIVWDRNGKKVKEFDSHKFMVTALALSPKGEQVASAGMDDNHCWKLWNRATGDVIHEFQGHKGWVSQARFSPDGKYVVTGSTDGTAILWELATRKPKYTFVHHHATVHDVAFTTRGDLLATAGMDGNVFIWNLDLADPAREPVQRLSGHIGSALGVSFNHNGTRVASGGFDRTVRVWDPKTGAEKITLRGHTDCVWSVAFSNDGLRIASASFDGTARIWDGTPQQEQSLPGEFTIPKHVADEKKGDDDHRVNRLIFDRDRKRLITASWDRTVGVWDAQTGENVLPPLNHDGPVWGVAVNPKGNRIVSGSWDTTVRLWDANNGNELRRPNDTTGEPHFARLTSPVQSVAMSHDGKRVVAGTWDGTVMGWEIETGKEVINRRLHYLPIFGMVFSPDDKYLVTASGDRTAKIWRIGSNDDGFPLQDHTATVFSVAFDKSGDRVATASWDKSVIIWKYASGRATFERRLGDAKDGHTDYVYGLAFDPSGERLATVGNDKTLRFWNVKTGQRIGETKTLRGVIWDVAYHPDGDRVATAIWNPKCWIKVVKVGR